MLFFPTITIGPINRFEDFLRSERRLRWDNAQFAKGLERILYGYAKVVILANWLIGVQLLPLINQVAPESPAVSLLLDSASYGFLLYFTFAGFSDIAIGLSFLFGYQVGENFNRPFLKPNIGEFWQSWHMSLSAWCRQYVFLPMYTKTRNLAIAMVSAMMTLGLWHEFSFRFLLLGCVSRFRNYSVPVVSTKVETENACNPKYHFETLCSCRCDRSNIRIRDCWIHDPTKFFFG